MVREKCSISGILRTTVLRKILQRAISWVIIIPVYEYTRCKEANSPSLKLSMQGLSLQEEVARPRSAPNLLVQDPSSTQGKQVKNNWVIIG